MEVSPTLARSAPASNPSTPIELDCDVCGYPRRGLAEASRCPECGAAPPAIVAVPRVIAHVRTRAELRWTRTLALGLIVLLVSWVFALRVVLVVPTESLSITALNVPAPKLATVATVQRAVGGYPGPWGVCGDLAVLGSLVGVWMITAARSARSTEEPMAPLRQLLRWVAMVSGGLAFGATLCEVGLWPGDAPLRNVIFLSVLLSEIPTAALLYLYLRQLAQRLEDGRAAVALERAAWYVPLLMAGSLSYAVVLYYVLDGKVTGLSRMVGTALGAASVVAGVAALGGYSRLTLTVCSRAGYVWLDGTPRGLLRRVGIVARALIQSLPRFAARWLVAAGIIAWVWFAAGRFSDTLFVERRAGLGGNLPLVNWLGPKLALTGLWVEGYTESRFSPSGIYGHLPLLAAVFLMTAGRRKSLTTHRLGRVIRWGTTAILGAAACVAISRTQHTISATWSRPLAWGMVLFDIPFTLLTYVYLSRVASAVGEPRLGRGLMRIGLCGAIVQAAPLALLVFGRALRRWYGSMPETAVAALYGAVSMVLTVLALTALGRLAWSIVRPACLELLSKGMARSAAAE
jgi:hypothetical protein